MKTIFAILSIVSAITLASENPARGCSGDWSFAYQDAWFGFGSSNVTKWRNSDVNGDGRTDLVNITWSASTIRVHTLFSSGNGNWTQYWQDAWPGFGLSDVDNWRIMDMNGDGRKDLVHVAWNSSVIRVHSLISNGNGTWTRVYHDAWPGFGRNDVTNWRAMDVNGDGREDLVHLMWTSPGNIRVHTLFSSGNGNWTIAYHDAVSGFGASDVANWRVTDVDGDSRKDLVHILFTNPGIRVHTLRSNGNGTFAFGYRDTWPGFGASDVQNWQVADINGDGRNDLVHVMWQTVDGGTIRAHTLFSGGYNQWTAEYHDAWSGFGASDVNNWRVMDVNGDGKVDLVHVLWSSPGNIRVHSLVSTGTGRWTKEYHDAWSGFGASDVLNWKAARVDDDARTDLVHVMWTAPGTVRVHSLFSRCTHWPERRAHCFSLPSLGRRHTISGSELRPTLERGEVCVESAFQVRDGIVLVDVDNPRIWDDAVVTGAIRTPAGASFQASDHLTTISDGQGEPARGGFFAYDTSGSVASVNSTLPRIPSGIGEFGISAQERIDLLTPGVRVGHSPVTINIQDVQSSGVPLRPHATFRMALNRDVLLVPVQVFAVFSDQLPSAADAFSRERALTVFDRGADVGLNKLQATDGDGRLSSTTILLPHVVLEGDTRPAHAGPHVLPDDIWAQCGIQFRLVNYSRIKVPNEIAIPPERTHLDIQGAPRALLAEVSRSPSFLDGVLTVMVSPWCSDVNQGGGGSIFPPSGQSLTGSNAVCIRSSAAGTVLAHEIGHSIMGNTSHVDCTRPGNDDNLMCPENGGPVLSAEQCIKARTGLVGTSRLQFPAPR